MPRYRVSGTVTIGIEMVVEADYEGDALDRAADQWPGLDDYAGNGARHGKLVGTTDERLTVDAGDDAPEFTHVQELTEED